MNIVKLQENLKDVPFKNLIFYVQSPNGQVPSYLALAEIKRRKDMESRAAATQNTPSHLSVAEEMTAPRQNIGPQFDTPQTMMATQQQAQPQMESGVASLPTGDMYQEDSFAGGGIVAFDDGGDVNYAGGGMVAFGPGGDVASKKYQAWQEDSYLSPGSLYAGAKDLIGMPFQYRVAYDPTSDKYMSRRALEGNTPSLDAYRKAAELRKQGLLAEADTLEKAASSPKVDRRGLAALDTPSAGADPGMTFSRDEIANIYQSTVPPTKTKAPMAEAVPQDDVTKPAPGPAVTPKRTGIDSLLEKTEGVAETEMDRYDRMMGVNPERAKLEALTKKYETGAGEQERMAPWMALAKAGFTMAGGKSPFAIQNLSEGAVAGLTDYAQAKDRLDKLNEKQIDIRSKLLQVDEARKSAGATYGLNSEAAIKTRNAQKELKQMEEENANLRNAASNATQLKAAQIAAAKKSDYETFIDLAKQDEDNYKTVKDKDGNVKKIFDAGKVTQTYRAFGPSGSTDKEFLEQYERQSMVDKDFKKKFPTAADYVLDQRARLSGANAPAASSTSSGFSNFRISK